MNVVDTTWLQCATSKTQIRAHNVVSSVTKWCGRWWPFMVNPYLFLLKTVAHSWGYKCELRRPYGCLKGYSIVRVHVLHSDLSDPREGQSWLRWMFGYNFKVNGNVFVCTLHTDSWDSGPNVLPAVISLYPCEANIAHRGPQWWIFAFTECYKSTVCV